MDLRQTVLLYQELTNNAWPAKQYAFFNGWIVRFSHGMFDRANSVLPIYYFGQNCQEDVHKIEDKYQNKHLDVIFQIPEYTSPDYLDRVLENMDYAVKSPTTVMMKALTHQSFSSPSLQFSSKRTDFEDAWFNTFQTFSNMALEKGTQMEAIIRRILPEKIFFTVKEDDQDVGVTLGVLERGYLGIYSLVVDPMKRKRSLGHSLMRFIEDWCINNSIHTIYLQVEQTNLAALNLYKKLGYQDLYFYHYRIKSRVDR
ncbi:MAG: GNAT family N-acetyltransferase [Promethearchaeota archaeon]